MRLEPTAISGVLLVHLDSVSDERGTFTRTFCAEEFVAAGLDPVVAQCSVSTNRLEGTLRGMHLQRSPHGETKLIRCTAGAIFDVAVDTRPDSATFGHWLGFELERSDALALVLAPGIAHGFLTLTTDAEIQYQISQNYHPDAVVGFRWDDPAVGIRWPSRPTAISDRDELLPSLAMMHEPSQHEANSEEDR